MPYEPNADGGLGTLPAIQRLVELGILAARDKPDPFLETDVPKVRLATACQRAGLPMEGIAAAIRSGRLSFAFLEAALYRRWAVRTGPTYRQVSQETGVPVELAPQLSVDFLPLMDRALLAGLRRQQELVWTEGLVDHIEDELEAAGTLGRPGRVPATTKPK